MRAGQYEVGDSTMHTRRRRRCRSTSPELATSPCRSVHQHRLDVLKRIVDLGTSWPGRSLLPPRPAAGRPRGEKMTISASSIYAWRPFVGTRPTSAPGSRTGNRSRHARPSLPRPRAPPRDGASLNGTTISAPGGRQLVITETLRQANRSCRRRSPGYRRPVPCR